MAGVTLDAQNWKLTTAITRQAAEDLQLAQGDQVTALFKATEVLERLFNGFWFRAHSSIKDWAFVSAAASAPLVYHKYCRLENQRFLSR